MLTFLSPASPPEPEPPPEPPLNELPPPPLHAVIEAIIRAMSPASSDVPRRRGERVIFGDSLVRGDAVMRTPGRPGRRATRKWWAGWPAWPSWDGDGEA